MSAQSWLVIASAAGQLFLGTLTLLRGGRSPVALPLALLCYDFFAFNIADLAFTVDRDPTWNYLDHIASPLGAPLALHVILIFTGRLRALRHVLWLAYGAMGLLSATAVLAFVVPAAAGFQDHRGWRVWHLVVDVAAMAVAVGALFRHLRVEIDPATRQRTRLILVAVLVGVPLALTDIVRDLWIPLPGLAYMATLLVTTLLAIAALRFRLFGADLSASAITVAAVLAIGGLTLYAAAFRVLVSHTAALVLGTVSAVFLLAFLARSITARAAARRARARQLATIGRFAGQLAHDLKNPLAAIKGASEFLLEEHRRGQPLDAQVKFVALIHEQVERIELSLGSFQRLGRVELVRTQVSVNELVDQVVEPLRLSRVPAVHVELELAPDVPEISADGELLTRALENIVRNALEAMPGGGLLTMRTASRGREVVISVEDTGEGMDAATCERALDDFYTTKPHGSGLGLSFARRVADAHGGELVLSSRKGRGTRVDLVIGA